MQTPKKVSHSTLGKLQLTTVHHELPLKLPRPPNTITTLSAPTSCFNRSDEVLQLLGIRNALLTIHSSTPKSLHSHYSQKKSGRLESRPLAYFQLNSETFNTCRDRRRDQLSCQPSAFQQPMHRWSTTRSRHLQHC